MKRWMAALAVLGLACGEAATIGGEEGPVRELFLQPLEVGTTWTYDTTRADGSDAERKVVKVLAVEEVDGHQAALLESVRGTRRTLVWLAPVDGRILRLREESWDGETLLDRRAFVPGSIRTPERIDQVRVGDRLPGDYVERALAADDTVRGERQRRAHYEVEAVADEVKTPAGTFFAVRLRKYGDDGEEGKLVWYAAGVGKVREEGGRIEVLRSWSAP